MPIYDNDGTASFEIKTIYDNDGTVNTQIRYVYDNDGTASSLIYNAEQSYGNLLIEFAAESPAFDSGSLLSYSANLDLRGYSKITFSVVDNDARVGFWIGSGTVYESATQGWRIYAAGAANAFYTSAKFGSSVTVDISGLTEAQKNGIKFSTEFDWAISTVTNSAFFGNWTITNLIAS